MAHDVFISYSARDKAVADAACATLESRKIRCWMAPRDVLPGRSWPGALVEAIGQSDVFVLVFSDGSNKSSQVVREVGEAVDRGIPIIPFRIEDVEPSEDMGFYIRSLHWLDALTPPVERHLQRLAETVELLLAATKEGQRQATIPDSEASSETTRSGVERLAAQEEAPVRLRRPRIAINISVQLRIALLLVCVVGGTWWALTYLQPVLSEVTRLITQVLGQFR
jgi:hypothetical protein